MERSGSLRTILAGCTALTAATLVATPVLAQQSNDDGGLDVIIVTAQKREQNLQDVPIAVTAISADTLEANRITNVVDLSGLAPGVSVRETAGSTGSPAFSVRGQLSYGIVAGSDKQTSVYLDGVYISSTHGSIFDLPDVERIEILRGPQGTLFGRNATTGAVSITTREPTGEAGVKAVATIGNQDHYRWGVSAETQQIGPFTAYFSYAHEERDGDIKNLGPRVTWDRTASRISRVEKVVRSAEYLGSKDVDSYFAALKFESGDFKAVYKYDRHESSNTPEATSLIALNSADPLLGSLLSAFVTSNDVTIEPDNGKRPDGVHNSWVIPTDQSVQGHSLTSTYVASDSLSFKSIIGYRKSFIFSTSSIGGISALPITQEAIAASVGTFFTLGAETLGEPWAALSSGAQSRSNQLSAEVQANYESDLLTATVGGLYFKSKDYVNEHWLSSNVAFSAVPGGVLPQAGIGEYFNKARSIAAFAQAEIHVTPQLDIILGARVTNDKKFGTFQFGATPAAAVMDDNTVVNNYKDTKFNYLIGVNYKPTQDILLYAKFSTSYVSGGTSASLPFDPETVKSAEAGIKAEFLNNKLRTNLTVWWADTKHQQAPSASSTTPVLFAEICPPSTTAAPNPVCGDGTPINPSPISVFVLDAGNKKSWGLEFDFLAAPARGVTIGGNVGYTHTQVYDVADALMTTTNDTYNGRLHVPKVTASVYAQYDTEPLFGEAYLSVRSDAIYQGTVQTAYNPEDLIFATHDSSGDVLLAPGESAPNAFETKAYWIVNGRVALKDINMGGVKADLGLWGRNLLDTERFSYTVNIADRLLGANYIPARSYGLDLSVSF